MSEEPKQINTRIRSYTSEKQNCSTTSRRAAKTRLNERGANGTNLSQQISFTFYIRCCPSNVSIKRAKRKLCLGHEKSMTRRWVSHRNFLLKVNSESVMGKFVTLYF
jgi:hypothetical protein